MELDFRTLKTKDLPTDLEIIQEDREFLIQELNKLKWKTVDVNFKDGIHKLTIIENFDYYFSTDKFGTEFLNFGSVNDCLIDGYNIEVKAIDKIITYPLNQRLQQRMQLSFQVGKVCFDLESEEWNSEEYIAYEGIED